jgi:hypothetical protein
MSTESWIVKTLGGDEWGFVKRLIINSVTRQISHADVIVAATGRLIRLPWESFEVRTEGIKLRISEGQVQVGARKPSDYKLAETVSMELWP